MPPKPNPPCPYTYPVPNTGRAGKDCPGPTRRLFIMAPHGLGRQAVGWLCLSCRRTFPDPATSARDGLHKRNIEGGHL